jgi:hypothetical protein
MKPRAPPRFQKEFAPNSLSSGVCFATVNPVEIWWCGASTDRASQEEQQETDAVAQLHAIFWLLVPKKWAASITLLPYSSAGTAHWQLASS